MKNKKFISVVTPCFNEESNIVELCERIRTTMEMLKESYEYEHIIVDNASTDGTVEVAKKLVTKDHNIKIIVNARCA